jgi:hypothetical protein
MTVTQRIARDLDRISSIAEEMGFSNLLFKGDRDHPGDELTIPTPGPGEVPAATGRRHSFVLRSELLFLRLRVLRFDFAAAANVPFTLTIQGVDAPFSGATDRNGQIEIEVPRNAQRGALTRCCAPARATRTEVSPLRPAMPEAASVAATPGREVRA